MTALEQQVWAAAFALALRANIEDVSRGALRLTPEEIANRSSVHADGAVRYFRMLPPA